MPVTTFSAAIHITPVVIKTFFKHWTKKIKTKKDREDEEAPQDDLIFDQAFHIVKSFIALGTKNTVESLQSFTNTHVPAPPWAAVCPVLIPLKTCNEAADRLIEWFGPDELKRVVGGERWWQVRGLDGIDAEWVAEEEHLASEAGFTYQDGTKMKDTEANILRMEALESVMLYIHGGGYFWGSINTHRYQILHFTNKFKGRAFAVNYRKAPQYPWPCPLQDVLSAYLYLIRPPPEALHKPISPSKIVFAGDSAGGGLCLATLIILRDLGIPLPAGAVLISPWVDLTHSFPSVMTNYDTDIIPKHGFLAKPSTLWPNPTTPHSGGRIVTTITDDPPLPGSVNTLKPSSERLQRKVKPEGEVYRPGEMVKSQQPMMDRDNKGPPTPDANPRRTSNEAQILEDVDDGQNSKIDHWEPKPPKILMENPNATPLELRSQIQMYTSTELLTHPLVSPILQGSLGNLPPLYILAGNGEVLRDEIIYLAHKAAHPADYPTRFSVLQDCTRQKENEKNFTTPTNVRLQVFDGMCHVLTVFMFTKSAKYAYRSIGAFIRHRTYHDPEYLDAYPFPESDGPHEESESIDKKYYGKKAQKGMKSKEDRELNSRGHEHGEDERSKERRSVMGSQVAHEQGITPNEYASNQENSGAKVPPWSTGLHERGKERDESAHGPSAVFIRERLDVHGKIRPMEVPAEIPALKLKPFEIGIIKEAPTQRWHDGQRIWDKRYHKDSQRVLKQKAKCEAQAERLLRHAFDQGFVHGDQEAVGANRSRDGGGEQDARTGQDLAVGPMKEAKKLRKTTPIGKIQADRRWGPLDLNDERPPATAIAGRRDTPEAVALLKKSIYHTAPSTHRTVPKLKAVDVVAATLDPNDDPNKPPKQSVSEQQVLANIAPFHGLDVWNSLLRYFGQKSAAQGVTCIDAPAGLKERHL